MYQHFGSIQSDLHCIKPVQHQATLVQWRITKNAVDVDCYGQLSHFVKEYVNIMN